MSSSRSRPTRRAAAEAAAPATPTPSSGTVRRSRSSRVKAEVHPEPEPEVSVDTPEEGEQGEGDSADTDGGEDEDEAENGMEEEEPAAGPSRASRGRGRRGRGRGRGGRARGRGRGGLRGMGDRNGQDEDEEEERRQYRVRARKSVSYKEILPEEVEEDEDDDMDDGEDEGLNGGAEEDDLGVEDGVSPAPRGGSSVPGTPSRRGRSQAKDEDEDDKDTPYMREKVGSGRGGFSVKGAAAAAARARWDKVRREKAERGEGGDDDDERRRKAVKRESKAAVESFKMGATLTVKGVEYNIGDDELELPDDPKGDTKVDAQGRLLGGREYKLVTFTSETRRDPNRVYALTIDAARACGYSDSLAFLRRCPQILKLSCNAAEREMLIDIGRVTGNLKHRMVTMVTMRNVYKLMGARVIKNGKWVTDDYYEDECLAKCAENGFTPHATVHEDEIVANALNSMERPQQTRGGLGETNTASFRQYSFVPFYALGGPSTHFGGNGADPWTDAGFGNKRAKLRNSGVSEEDWMLRVAEECRRVDETLKEYRAERVGVLEGQDLKGWTFHTERITDGDRPTADTTAAATGEAGMTSKAEGAGTPAPGEDDHLKPPGITRKRSGLSREVTFEPDTAVDRTELTATSTMAKEGGGDMRTEVDDEPVDGPPQARSDATERTAGGKIIVQSAEDEARWRDKLGWGKGSWKAGVIEAVYEPHTHIPHVPIHTQPTAASFDRLSYQPLLPSRPDTKYRSFKGLASFEYVFDPSSAGEEDRLRREKEVQEAVEWERQSREKKRSRGEAVIA